VDASTGIVRALRLHRWRPELTTAAVEAVASQLARPFDDDRAGQRLRELYAASRSSADMVASRAGVIQHPHDDDLVGEPELIVYHDVEEPPVQLRSVNPSSEVSPTGEPDVGAQRRRRRLPDDAEPFAWPTNPELLTWLAADRLFVL
jgi:hypothetical protein